MSQEINEDTNTNTDNTNDMDNKSMTDPRDRFEDLMAKIMSDGLATIDNLTDKELEMIDLEKPFTYEYIVGDIVQVVATNAEDAQRMIADGNYEVIEAYSQCVAVRNA